MGPDRDTPCEIIMSLIPESPRDGLRRIHLMPPALARLDAMLAARRGAVTLLLILAAVTVRAVFWSQLAHGPCGALHRWEQSDMHHFDGWARAVAAGDLKSETVAIPLNLPHRAIASDYLAANPDDPARASSDPVRALWDRWLGDGRFYQEPLYPYLAAAIYWAAPDTGVRVVAWLQMLVGVLTILWIRRIADRRFGPTAGLLAGAGGIAAGPLLFYEALLLRESLIAFASLILVDAADRALDRGGAMRWAGLGLLVGLSAMLKGHFALFGVGMAILAVWHLRRSPGPAATAVLAFLGAWLVALAPMIARNLAMGVPPLATASGGGYTFLLANLPDADPAQGGTAGVARFIEATRGRLAPSFFAAISAWETPLGWAGLIVRKAAILLHWPEVPNNENWALFRAYAPVLALLPVSFAALLPTAVVGWIAGLRRPFRDAPLSLMIATHVATMLLFMPLGRFRAPLVTLLLPLAAGGLLWLAAHLLNRKWRPALAGLAIVALTAVLVWRPAPPGSNAVRPSDHAATLQAWYLPLGTAAVETGQWHAATTIFQEAQDHAPEVMHRIAAGDPADLRHWEIPLADLYADIWRGMALAQQSTGRYDEAAASRKGAERLAHRSANAPLDDP
jgi:hypothetical protein